MATSPLGVEIKVPEDTQRQREQGPPSPPQAPETAPGGLFSWAMGPPGMTHRPSNKQRPTGHGFPVVAVVFPQGCGSGSVLGNGGGMGFGVVVTGGTGNASAVAGCVGVAGTRNGDGTTGLDVTTGATCGGSAGCLAIGRGSGAIVSTGFAGDSASTFTPEESAFWHDVRLNATNPALTTVRMRPS